MSRLHRLAVELVLDKRPIVDDAVALASELVAAGLDTPATIEVASLYSNTPLSQAEPLLRSMLADQGIEIPPFSTEDEQYSALRHAFAYWDLPLAEFEGPFYLQIPEWDLQGPLDRELIAMLDQRDHESEPQRRDEIAENMREAIRQAGSQ